MNTPLDMRTALDERIGQLAQELKTLAGKIDNLTQSLLPAAVRSTASFAPRSLRREGSAARRVSRVGKSAASALYSGRRQPVRMAAAGALILAMLGLAGFYVRQILLPPPQPVAVIEIVGSRDGFNQKVVHVKVGQPVTVRLINPTNTKSISEDGKHQWAVEELGINLIAAPESSNSVTFTPKHAGSFTFYCDICCGGRANPVMDGTLIVEG